MLGLIPAAKGTVLALMESDTRKWREALMCMQKMMVASVALEPSRL